MEKVQGKSEIQEFYKGTNVFVTGGTGFMGKILIEKLLRDTEIETIYVLIREKKGKTPHMRIDSLFDDVIFDRVKAEKPKCRNKIEAIPGDCSLAGLGISITDRQKLISNINVVFHVAATVNFNEQIKLAYNINVNGTKNLLNLAREMTSLKSVMHVSTAFSNCTRLEIDEQIYDHPLRCSDVEAVLEKMSEHESDLCTSQFLGNWPNTYTFTKAMAESLIKDISNGIPIGIFRPGIVVSTYKEPFTGWIDNLYGPTGMTVGTISGFLRVSFADEMQQADIVPVDTCVAGLIAAAWNTAQRNIERKTENIPVFNYVSSPENPIIWREFRDLNMIYGNTYASCNAIWCPFNISTVNPYVYSILVFFLHILPAAVMDLFSLLIGRKPTLLKVYKKIHKFSNILQFFCTREWKFSNKNTQALWLKMNKTDQELFPFSMKHVLWSQFFKRYLKGIRKYLLKEPESTLKSGKLRIERFIILHHIIKNVTVYLVISLALSLLKNTWNVIFG
ncbi:fatty acyl-CoA reductase wat-like [Euwallacea similis]|uniref:fatty acyl-CoA reductase wat-like n=1 Tax=Euwallacea similis TaxID=1736056 RepID=UPI00344C0C87